ncbi:sialin-like isoform X2 [Tachypleus tridentatus]|uniref:sialin-like isoform X2 n=1 Tax=Tachypleus tridentatus TaxID=6853 RepID=UPI003FCFE7C0
MAICAARYAVAFFVFWAIFIMYSFRASMSIAIIAMVNHTALRTLSVYQENQSVFSECPLVRDMNLEEEKIESGSFLWDEKEQGIILGAEYYGFITTQLLGGRLAEIIGAKWVIGMGMFGASLLTLLEPYAAQLGIGPLVAARVAEGIGKGVLVPAKFALLASWVPVHERSVLVAITGQGAMFGLLVAMPLTGIICKNLGWEYAFYFYGSFGCIWFVCWIWYVHNSPEKHSYISQKELNYILEHRLSGKRESQKRYLPWNKLITSRAVWVLTLTKFFSAFGFYTLLTEIPSYFKTVLHFEIQNNGLWTATLYVAQSITMITSAILADYMRSRDYLSITNIRKLFQSIALIGSAMCFIAIAHVGCNYYSAIILLIIETSFYGFTSGGDGPMAADITPDFAGTVVGFMHTIIDIAGILAPLAVGLLTQHNASMQQWKKVFYIVGGINIAGALLFVLFSTAEPEPWAVEYKEYQELKIVHIKEDDNIEEDYI